MDKDRLLVRGSFNGRSEPLNKSFTECGMHRDYRCSEIRRALLHYWRGDDLLQVGWVDGQTFMLLAKQSLRMFLGGNGPTA